ncbi:type IV pilin protein [Paraburkholderia sp.]|uniref:type IV pilin protein n=1 Tax=Paraburkholderia sp. TaxID=1926495 RepID=UPI0023839438|nr:type IV pilin protein [Paraburkholderia sp.]MDE1183418.1 type IV pilin protein [Paraburkholderia sp.]
MKKMKNGTETAYADAFTLIELVIALAIAAILAAFAVPSYRTHVVHTHRVDAATALYRAAQFVEADTSAGVSATQGGASQNGGVPVLPVGVDQAPSFGAAIYRLSILPADQTNGGYAVEARPSETGPMRDDACGVFILDATGLRTNRGPDGNAAADNMNCWNAK